MKIFWDGKNIIHAKLQQNDLEKSKIFIRNQLEFASDF